MNKRYTVISAQTPRGPEYRIYDRINECSIEGGFDTQKWAEAVAEMMESKWGINAKQEVTTMTDEHRVTVKDIIDLLDYNLEGRRNIRVIDSESRGDGSLIQTDSVLLEFLAKLPVDCIDAKGNVIVMYLNTDAVNEAWRKFSGGV